MNEYNEEELKIIRIIYDADGYCLETPIDAARSFMECDNCPIYKEEHKNCNGRASSIKIKCKEILFSYKK
jgi:hypothetical protein